MAKNNTNMFLIFGAIALLILLTQTPLLDNLKEISSSNGGASKDKTKNTGTNPDTDMVSLKCYGKDKNQVDCKTGFDIGVSQFSIVGGVPEIYFIDLTITLTSTGARALSCDLVSLSPSAFDSSIVKTTKTLPISGKTAWTSSLIDVSQFEGLTQPTTFSATARCFYVSGGVTTTLDDKIGSLPLTILADESGEGGFDIGIDTGGTPTEFCGDGICQVNEDSISCPSDCAVSTSVSFRTSDLSYVSGSAIAFTSSCGNTLTSYGYETKTSAGGTCATDGNFGALILSGLPVSSSFNTHSGGSTGNLLLYADSSDGNEVWVCEDDSDGSGVIKARYDSTDSDSTAVNTDSESFVEAKEINC